MKQQLKIKIFLILILSCKNVHGQSEELQLHLPTIETENVQLTELDNKEYMLRITLPDSERTEFISLDSSDAVVLVRGSINTYYPDSMTNLVINYVADKNGYRASYKFGTAINQQQPSFAPSFNTRLSTQDLKSLAG